MPVDVVEPAWTAPSGVYALCTTRAGGVSRGRYATLNLASHVGDAPGHVAENRKRLLRRAACSRVQWLRQVHGARVASVTAPEAGGQLSRSEQPDEANASPPVADAAWTDAPGVGLAVMVADCAPVLLHDVAGGLVAVAHCGWRGATGGVIEATLQALPTPPQRLAAWIGPAICQGCYQVGEDVYRQAGGGAAFAADGHHKWRFDLPGYVAAKLAALGVGAVTRCGLCTSCHEGFFSHRRDGATGRMAAVIWLR